MAVRGAEEKTGRTCRGACAGPEDNIVRVWCCADVPHGRQGIGTSAVVVSGRARWLKFIGRSFGRLVSSAVGDGG